MVDDSQPLDAWFDAQRTTIEDTYLQSEDEYRQSGWNSTPERWRAGREVILDGVVKDGDFLDIGCANGRLLQSLMEWGTARGVSIVPHGIDFVPALIELARARFPEHAGNFTVANAFTWKPERQYAYVHTLLEYVPKNEQPAYLQRLLDEVVAPGGRLIVSSYGSRSEEQRAVDIDFHLQMLGFRTAGCGNGRDEDGWIATRAAWIDR